MMRRLPRFYGQLSKPLSPKLWVVGTMGLTLRELYGIIADKGEGEMNERYAARGSVEHMIETLGGEEIARLLPEDIAGNVTAVTLLQNNTVTAYLQLHEAREDVRSLRERVDNLQNQNTSLREIKASYEATRFKPYSDIIVSVLLGFGITEWVRSPEEITGSVVAIGTGLVILCSIVYELLRWRGGQK